MKMPPEPENACTREALSGAIQRLWVGLATEAGCNPDPEVIAPLVDGHPSIGFSVRAFCDPGKINGGDPAVTRAMDGLMIALDHAGFAIAPRDGEHCQFHDCARVVLGWKSSAQALHEHHKCSRQARANGTAL